jgi:hypothetical protein
LKHGDVIFTKPKKVVKHAEYEREPEMAAGDPPPQVDRQNPPSAPSVGVPVIYANNPSETLRGIAFSSTLAEPSRDGFRMPKNATWAGRSSAARPICKAHAKHNHVLYPWNCVV